VISAACPHPVDFLPLSCQVTVTTKNKGFGPLLQTASAVVQLGPAMVLFFVVFSLTV